MKTKTRLLCFLLALILLVSVLPVYALADTTETETTDPTEETKPATATATIKVVVGKTTLYTYKVEVGDEPVTLDDDQYIQHKKKYYEFSYYTISGKKVKENYVTIDAFDSDNAAAWQKKWGDTIKVVYKAHSHSYRFSFGRVFHWNICKCGATTNEVRHVDPATDSDKICTCGYKFNDNADLTTLWMSGMVLSPAFNKETTEYIGQVWTYQDITSTKITAYPFDAMAKIQLPANLEIHEGANKFEIVVTAEDKTATKTYTVIAVKPFKVDDTLISTDGTTISTPLKTTIKKLEATAAPSEAVCAKILELAAADKSTAITFQTSISKWSTKHSDVTLSGEFLKGIAETTEAALAFPTAYETTLTIPHSEIAALAEGREAVTFRVAKDNTFAILVNGEPIPVSEAITLTLPEKK